MSRRLFRRRFMPPHLDPDVLGADVREVLGHFEGALHDLAGGEGAPPDFRPDRFLAPGVPRIRPVLVLLAAEVVAICYYHLLATRLPPTRLKSLLAQLVNDERAHLHFHTDFLRSQTKSTWRRAVFICAWRATMAAAAIVVLIDHRQALRDLDLKTSTVLRRWICYSRLAERLVVNAGTKSDRVPENPGRAGQALAS